ncbi:MAG: lysophospholipid acyltransferase family protein [Alphaproteobacteria bacterium]|nr:lysophospholipid acyltransferase family protein [Alphaproteobacteria bacterium]
MLWRSGLFNFCFYLLMVLFLIVCLSLLFLPLSFRIKLFCLWGGVVMFLHRWIVGVEVEVRGLDRLPEPPFFVASAHQSTWDTQVLFYFLSFPVILMKQELFRIPVLGFYFSNLGFIPVNRSGGVTVLRNLLAATKTALADKREVLIFPEGSRCAPGNFPVCKPGIAFLYSHLDLPCVPVSLNSGLFWPRRSAVHFSGKIIVDFLKPIPPGLPRKDFMGRLEKSIADGNRCLIKETAEAPDPPPTVKAALERLSSQLQTENQGCLAETNDA